MQALNFYAQAMTKTAFPAHLTGIDDLTPQQIKALLDRALALKSGAAIKSLDGRVILTLFFEDSTRTRTSFKIAAKRLGAEVVNWDVKTSALSKNESLLDTIQTLGAMQPDAVIVRSREYNAPHFISGQVACPVINAGDSTREHPTQALLDALTMREAKGALETLTVAICGDVAHSRVAGANIRLLGKMGATVRVIAPESLMPQEFPAEGVETYTDLKEGLPGCDIVMALRIQKERMESADIPDTAWVHKHYGITLDRLNLAGPEALLMHPGPMNRGIEVDESLPDDPQRSLILQQVANGVWVRMAVLEEMLGDT